MVNVPRYTYSWPLGEEMNAEKSRSAGPGPSADDEIIRQVIEAIQSVRFGQVQIFIQDSRVVQIDKTEKVRLA